MTSDLYAHLAHMQEKSLLAATMLPAAILNVSDPDPKRKVLSFEALDAVGVLLDEINGGLDGTLHRIKKMAEDAA